MMPSSSSSFFSSRCRTVTAMVVVVVLVIAVVATTKPPPLSVECSNKKVDKNNLAFQTRDPPMQIRPFRPYTSNEQGGTSYSYGWCLPETDPSYTHDNQKNQVVVQGLIYVKNPKAASSTSAGINNRIAHNVLQRRRQEQQQFVGIYNDTTASNATTCRHFEKHGSMFTRRSPPFYLWTMVRHPAARVLSSLYYRLGREPTDRERIYELKKGTNAQVRYLSTKQDRSVQGIFDTYHFIGLVERMDESLVVLKLLLGLQDLDVIVFSSKSSGGYVADPKLSTCRPLPLANKNTSEAVSHVLTTTFREKSAQEYLLYQMINQTLDATIDVLGRARVQAEVIKHKRLAAWAQEECLAEAVFPCDAHGNLHANASRQSCYFRDWGCGYACLDRLQETYLRAGKRIPETISKR